MNGWAGQVLDIDLTSGAIKTYPLDEKMAHLFLGGRGLGARMLWDEVGPERRSAFAGERVDLYQRPADGDRLSDQQSLLGQHQKPAHRYRVGRQFGRLLGHAVQEDRLRCADRARQSREAGLHRDQAGRRHDQRRRAPVGQARARNHHSCWARTTTSATCCASARRARTSAASPRS